MAGGKKDGESEREKERRRGRGHVFFSFFFLLSTTFQDLHLENWMREEASGFPGK